jgi:hypothetical protein
MKCVAQLGPPVGSCRLARAPPDGPCSAAKGLPRSRSPCLDRAAREALAYTAFIWSFFLLFLLASLWRSHWTNIDVHGLSSQSLQRITRFVSTLDVLLSEKAFTFSTTPAGANFFALEPSQIHHFLKLKRRMIELNRLCFFNKYSSLALARIARPKKSHGLSELKRNVCAAWLRADFT